MISRKRAALPTAVLILLLSLGACSSKPFLVVQYQLPAKTDTLAGREVLPIVSDLRENNAFLTENAQNSLKAFNDTYSLVAVKEDGSGNLLGIYEVESLMTELFKLRLENMGIRVPPPTSIPDYKLDINLEGFKLDLVGSKWVMQMSYQASLLKDGRQLAMESVSGSAERLKVMGKGDAEKLLSDLMSDMVNKLDLAKLFLQARS